VYPSVKLTEQKNEADKTIINNYIMYYIIPEKIIKDKKISPNSKLLYAVISHESFDYMCDKSNRWFSDLFGVDRKSISRWIGQLDESGYIRRKTKISKDEFGYISYTRLIVIK